MSSNKSILGIGNSQKRSNNFNNKERKKLIFKAQEVDRSQLVHKLGNYLVSDYTIGQGSYAKVRLASQIQTSQIFAMKIIKKPEIDQSKHYTRIKREVENLKGLRHSNIIQLHDVFQTKRFICIVMEYAPAGDLFELIRSQPEKRLDEYDALRLFKQMVSAVEHCHSQHVVHRDLKPENVLLDINGNVKIADFGFSRTFDPDGSLLSTCCGSVGYAAPELLLGEKYEGPAADVWSLGVILYTMLCGVGPFQVEEGMSKEVEERMLNGDFLHSHHLSKFTKYIISCMFEPDATARITLSGIKRLLDLYELYDFPDHNNNINNINNNNINNNNLNNNNNNLNNNNNGNNNNNNNNNNEEEDEVFTKWIEEKSNFKRKKRNRNRIQTHRKCDSENISISNPLTPVRISDHYQNYSSDPMDVDIPNNNNNNINNNNNNRVTLLNLSHLNNRTLSNSA